MPSNKELSTCSKPSACRQSHHTRYEIKCCKMRQNLAFFYRNFRLTEQVIEEFRSRINARHHEVVARTSASYIQQVTFGVVDFL